MIQEFTPKDGQNPSPEGKLFNRFFHYLESAFNGEILTYEGLLSGLKPIYEEYSSAVEKAVTRLQHSLYLNI